MRAAASARAVRAALAASVASSARRGDAGRPATHGPAQRAPGWCRGRVRGGGLASELTPVARRRARSWPMGGLSAITAAGPRRPAPGVGGGRGRCHRYPSRPAHGPPQHFHRGSRARWSCVPAVTGDVEGLAPTPAQWPRCPSGAARCRYARTARAARQVQRLELAISRPPHGVGCTRAFLATSSAESLRKLWHARRFTPLRVVVSTTTHRGKTTCGVLDRCCAASDSQRWRVQNRSTVEARQTENRPRAAPRQASAGDGYAHPLKGTMRHSGSWRPGPPCCSGGLRWDRPHSLVVARPAPASRTAPPCRHRAAYPKLAGRPQRQGNRQRPCLDLLRHHATKVTPR